MNLVKMLATLVWKDVIIEARRAYEVAAILAFPLAGALTFSLLAGEGSGPEPLAFTLIISLLSTFFITTTSFTREYDKHTLQGLKTLPIPPSLLFAAKTVYTFVMVSIASLATLACIWVFNGLPNVDPVATVVLVAVVGLNLSGISSLVSALTMYSEGKFLLIPLITLIYSFPVILLSAAAIDSLMLGQPIGSQLSVLGLHYLAFTAFALLLSEIVVGE